MHEESGIPGITLEITREHPKVGKPGEGTALARAPLPAASTPVATTQPMQNRFAIATPTARRIEPPPRCRFCGGSLKRVTVQALDPHTKKNVVTVYTNCFSCGKPQEDRPGMQRAVAHSTLGTAQQRAATAEARCRELEAQVAGMAAAQATLATLASQVEALARENAELKELLEQAG